MNTGQHQEREKEVKNEVKDPYIPPKFLDKLHFF